MSRAHLQYMWNEWNNIIFSRLCGPCCFPDTSSCLLWNISKKKTILWGYLPSTNGLALNIVERLAAEEQNKAKRRVDIDLVFRVLETQL